MQNLNLYANFTKDLYTYSYIYESTAPTYVQATAYLSQLQQLHSSQQTIECSQRKPLLVQLFKKPKEHIKYASVAAGELPMLPKATA